MPIFKVEGVVTLGGGFAYEFEAPDETMARSMARNRALDEPWDDAEIQEVEIQYLAQEPPCPPLTARGGGMLNEGTIASATAWARFELSDAQISDLARGMARIVVEPVDLNDGKKEST